MCGIVGYTGPREAGPILIEGLRRRYEHAAVQNSRARGACGAAAPDREDTGGEHAAPDPGTRDHAGSLAPRRKEAGPCGPAL